MAAAGVKVGAAALKGALVGGLVTTTGPVGLAASIALSSVLDAATDGLVDNLANGAKSFVDKAVPGKVSAGSLGDALTPRISL